MDIRDVKIKDEDWQKFRQYISYDDFDVELGVSIILFDLNKEDTIFKDIVETVKSYQEEFINDEEIFDVYMWRKELSKVDPIFFQCFAQDVLGIELDDYSEQAQVGAFHYCEEFVHELYHKMDKDGLFD